MKISISVTHCTVKGILKKNPNIIKSNAFINAFLLQLTYIQLLGSIIFLFLNNVLFYLKAYYMPKIIKTLKLPKMSVFYKVLI